MFHAELISLSRGQSYDQVDILEVKRGDFDKYNIKKPFGDRTIAFFHNSNLIIAHPWGIRIIHLDRNQRGGSEDNCFAFDRIILDGDISYQDGVYIDDQHFADLGIPDLFADESDIIDQVAFSCSQGVFITHDANIVSMICSYPRGARGITKSSCKKSNSESRTILSKINRR